MRINFNNFISFEKKLVANCSIKNNEQKEDCKIYKLNKKEDRRYFLDLSKNKEWNHFHYIYVADGEFRNGLLPSEFYVLETEDEKCLGYCQVVTDEEEYDELYILETKPSEIADNENRQRKYIGETLLSFLVKKAFKKGKKQFLINYPAPSAYFFYEDKCGFKYDRKQERLALTPIASEKLISQNEKHTNGKIEIIA